MSLRHAVMATLSYRPKSGYEIAKSIEGGIGFFWKATHQQIYRELSGLEEEGWVNHKEIEQSNAPAKKLFRLSRAGLKELKDWIEGDTDAALIRDPFLIKVFVGHLIQPEKLLGVIAAQKEKRLKILARYHDIEKRYFSDLTTLSVPMRFQYLVVRRGITHAQSWLEWIAEVEAFVRSI